MYFWPLPVMCVTKKDLTSAKTLSYKQLENFNKKKQNKKANQSKQKDEIEDIKAFFCGFLSTVPAIQYLPVSLSATHSATDERRGIAPRASGDNDDLVRYSKP